LDSKGSPEGRREREAARTELLALIEKAEALVPGTLVDPLPSAEGSGGEPAWHGFERALWGLGEKIRQRLLRHPRLRADGEIQERLVAIATDRRARRGRQSFILLLGYKVFATCAGRLAGRSWTPAWKGT